MKGVRLQTERLIVRDLPPRFGPVVARFHRDNREFHAPWEPGRPQGYFTPAAQRRILRNEARAPDMLHLWIFERRDAARRRTGPIAGSVTLSGIVRGNFQSCYLGYKLDRRFVGRGYMTESLRAVIDHAFGSMNLHRLEANIMPSNVRSLNLVTGLGFVNEGVASRYLRIQGTWQDHIHMVLLNE